MQLSYECSECGKPIGLMADKDGQPVMYRCPNTGRLAQPQEPIHRETKRMSLVARLDVLRQLRIKDR